MSRMITFESYLQERHAENYRGLKDDMSDAFEAWLESKDVAYIMEAGEKYRQVVMSEMCKRAKTVVDDLLTQGYNFDALQEFLVRYNHELI